MNNKTKNNSESAEKIVSESIARNKFNGDVSFKVIAERPCFSGMSDLKGNVKVSYNPQYPLHHVPYNDPFCFALEALVNHEIFHQSDAEERGCPRDKTTDLSHILTPVSEVLRSKGLPNVPFGSQGHTLYTFFANLFEDFVVNNIVSANNGSRGVFLLYDDVSSHTQGLNKLFEAFIKLQARTFSRKEGMHLMLKHFNQSKEASHTVNSYLKRTNIMAVPKERRADFLSTPKNWDKLSRLFAEEFSKLIDPMNLQASFFSVICGNDFSRLDDEQTQMSIAIDYYNASKGEFKPPVFMDNNMALLSLYHRLARNIDMKVTSHSVETQRPITHVSRRQFDSSKDQLESLVFGLNKHGKLEAQTGKYPVMVKSRYQVTAGNFPEVRYGFLDCSSSTQSQIPGKTGKIMNPWASKNMQWTDASIYHHELLIFFGLNELFRRRGTLKSSNVKLGVFSNTTRIAEGLLESEKLALQPEFGGTTFDEESLNEIFNGNGCLVYTISDGEITNWDDIKHKFIEAAKKHHYFHVQIGRESQMYNDLKKAGLNAFLDDGTNTAKTIIDLTQKQVYGEAI